MGSGREEEPPVKPGERFVNKYEVERVIGRGGMGIVFAARHVELGTRVAIKLLLPKLHDDESLVKRFVREAKAAARIAGEHVARVLDVGRREDGAPFMVLELLSGKDLHEIVKERGPLPPTVAVDYVLEAAHGLAQAHALGIVHRDVKPSNLFLAARAGASPIVKVLDFGISKVLEDVGDAAVTQTREVIGSPHYMSPEQLRASRDVDVRTDVWSVGVVLFELLTGSLPFVGKSAIAIGGSILHDPPRSLRSRRPEVPEALEAVVMRCLDKAVEARPSTMQELAVALAPFASERGAKLAKNVLRVTPESAARALLPSLDDEEDAVTASVPTKPAVDPTASDRLMFATTERGWMASSPPPATTAATNRSRWIVAGGAAAILATLVLAAVGLRFRSLDRAAEAAPPPAVVDVARATPTADPVVKTVSDDAPVPSASASSRGTSPARRSRAAVAASPVVTPAAPEPTASGTIVRDRHGGE